MIELTVRKAIRYFLLTELIAMAIIGVGLLLGQNGCLVSLGLLFMMGGIAFLTYAGNLKAQQRMIEAAEKVRQEQGLYADDVEGEIESRYLDHTEPGTAIADNPSGKQ